MTEREPMRNRGTAAHPECFGVGGVGLVFIAYKTRSLCLSVGWLGWLWLLRVGVEKADKSLEGRGTKLPFLSEEKTLGIGV